MSKLKIGKLPDTTPVKLSVAVPPDLQAELQDYAAVYEKAYGEKAKVTDLIPSMLASFLASDSNFKKARKQTPFTMTHDCLYELLHWLRRERLNTNPDLSATYVAFDEIWARRGPHDHAFGDDYAPPIRTAA